MKRQLSVDQARHDPRLLTKGPWKEWTGTELESKYGGMYAVGDAGCGF